MKYTLFQTLIVFILLLLFAVADYGFLKQHDHFVSRLEELPVIIFSHNWDSLQELAIKLGNHSQVKHFKMERNAEILKKLVSEYDLPQADQIIDLELLPNLLEFTINGVYSTEKEFMLLKETIVSIDSEAIIISPDYELKTIFNLKKSIYITRRLLFLGMLLIIFANTLMFRIIAIRKDNFFWKMYYRCGGLERRFKYYFLNSLVASLLPIISFWGVAYLVDKQLHYTYYLDNKSWLLIIVVILITNPLAWIITGKE